MSTTKYVPALTVGAALLVAAYGIGHAQGETSPASVTVVYEEDGTVDRVDLTRDGEAIETTRMDERWRGNDDAADGLYLTDPADKEN